MYLLCDAPCEECDGTGEVETWDPEELVSGLETCPHCHGSGLQELGHEYE